MEKHSTDSGETSSGTDSTASRKSKPKTYVVSNPLPPSRISWLKRQSKHVAEVSKRRLGQIKAEPPLVIPAE